MAATQEILMARVRGKKSDRDDVAVKVDRTLVGMARLIATQRGISVAELLSSLLDSPIRKAYATMLRELERDPRREAGDG